MAHLPEKITVVLRNDKQLVRYPLDSTDITVEQEVHPAFICDAYNLKQIETAKYWGSQGSSYNKQTYSYIQSGYTILENIDNKPISNVKIIGIEHRGNGGRAYKVMFQLDGKDLYADMREETILDIMYNDGIEKGACLTGEYIWIADYGSQFIRVGSERYRKLDKSKTKPADGLGVISRDWVLYKTQKNTYRIRLSFMQGIKVKCLLKYKDAYGYDRTLLIHNKTDIDYYNKNPQGKLQMFEACKQLYCQNFEITLNKKYKEGDEIIDYSFFKDTRDYSGKKDLGFIIKTFDTKKEQDNLISLINEWGLSKLDVENLVPTQDNLIENEGFLLATLSGSKNTPYNSYYNTNPITCTIKNEKLYNILNNISEVNRDGSPTNQIILKKGI